MAAVMSLLSKPWGDSSTKDHGDQLVSEEELAAADVSPGLRDGLPQAGEQALGENSTGGLGRHLGLVSTTLLM